jgi:hypothetical protein
MRHFVHSPHLTYAYGRSQSAHNTQEQPSQTSSVLLQTLSGGSILDSLKLILAGAGLSDVLATVARLIEAQLPGMLCSIFILERVGLGLRYSAAPNLPEAYRAATDGMVIGPNIGSCGRAAFLRQPVFASDILSDPNWAKFKDATASAGLRAAGRVQLPGQVSAFRTAVRGASSVTFEWFPAAWILLFFRSDR